MSLIELHGDIIFVDDDGTEHPHKAVTTLTERHFGPGPHPSGSEQEAHAGNDLDWSPRIDEFAEWEELGELVKITGENEDGTFTVEIVTGPERLSTYRDVRGDGLSEADEDDLEMWQSNEPSDVRARAITVFGLTDDANEAGYILPDGSMLDFSGKMEGGAAGSRQRDHREINSILLGDTGKPIPVFQQQTRSLRVHIDSDSLIVDFLTAPTGAQKRLIEDVGATKQNFIYDISRYDSESDVWGTIESGELADPTADEIREVLDDVPVVMTRRSIGDLLPIRHYGPGPHPSGSSQNVHAGGRGGAANGKFPIERIREFEAEIVNNEYESLGIFDQDGQLVHHQIGSEYSVPVKNDDQDWLKAFDARNMSLLATHNHPNSYRSPLSVGDMFFAHNIRADEIVAVSDGLRSRILLSRKAQDDPSWWSGGENMAGGAYDLFIDLQDTYNTRGVVALPPSERHGGNFSRIFNEATRRAWREVADRYPEYMQYAEEES